MIKRFHGGDLGSIKESYADAPKPWIDLSTGINPHCWPWREKLAAAELDSAAARLPEQADFDFCRSACASYLGVRAGQIILTPGSQVGIEVLPDFFDKSQLVYILGPTYTEHARAWQAEGYDVEHVPYEWDVLSALPDGSIIVVTHPNNPDGRYFDPQKLYDFCQDFIGRGGAVIIDEAFGDVIPSASMLQYPLLDGMVVLRSLGKFSGLAGLRLGAIVVTEDGADKINETRPLWDISTVTLRVAGHFYQDENWINDMRATLAADMDRMQNLLLSAGFRIVGSTSLYCLVSAENSRQRAEDMARAGLYVRIYHDHPEWIRFGLPADAAAWARLEKILRG